MDVGRHCHQNSLSVSFVCAGDGCVDSACPQTTTIPFTIHSAVTMLTFPVVTVCKSSPQTTIPFYCTVLVFLVLFRTQVKKQKSMLRREAVACLIYSTKRCFLPSSQRVTSRSGEYVHLIAALPVFSDKGAHLSQAGNCNLRQFHSPTSYNIIV